MAAVLLAEVALVLGEVVGADELAREEACALQADRAVAAGAPGAVAAAPATAVRDLSSS